MYKYVVVCMLYQLHIQADTLLRTEYSHGTYKYMRGISRAKGNHYVAQDHVCPLAQRAWPCQPLLFRRTDPDGMRLPPALDAGSRRCRSEITLHVSGIYF